MGKKIIVAGGGHGGIAAGALLAKNGYDVTVYEKRKREDMGYDWTDIFDKKGLFAAGMEMPAEDKYKFKNDMTFYSPNMNVGLRQHVPQDQLEIQMERKEIYNHIITYAEQCGVKFEYETDILYPVMLGSRVAGIKTDKGTVYADLVIDAAGMNSVIRRNLPEHLGIQSSVQPYEQFYVYRGFFNKTAECDEDKFKLLLLHQNQMGIYWVAAEEEHTDVLIGRFTPLSMEDVEDALKYLRESNPHLGTELVRGGQFVNIPVRQPLGVMVADGYAAIGDSAFMTVPVIGSGIANCLKASKMLADTIIEDTTDSYSADILWKYQRKYFKELGNGFAPLACVKLLLTRLYSDELDYIFDSGILNADDMTIGADSTNIGAILGGVTKESIKKKLVGLKNNPVVLKKVLRCVKELGTAAAVTSAMPKSYNKKAVNMWVKQYNNCFKH
ncbi:MAG: NAD(P)-binding protein [Clostridia bacterium]|nr:NAD(P)-binding protein [Clostridia bacterium]